MRTGARGKQPLRGTHPARRKRQNENHFVVYDNISDKAYNQCQFTEGCRTSYLSETVLQKQKPAGLRAAELLTAEQ